MPTRALAELLDLSGQVAIITGATFDVNGGILKR